MKKAIDVIESEVFTSRKPVEIPEDIDTNIHPFKSNIENRCDEDASEPSCESEILTSESSIKNSSFIWDRFMFNISLESKHEDKSSRMACRIDRNLAETLDDIDIGNRSRSDLVNAIIKSFFDVHLTDISLYRRKSTSLLNQV